MPIGKNAIKRVANNGYSNVKTAAPDMENSTELLEKDAVVTEKLTPPTPAPKKRTRTAKKTVKKEDSAPKKSMETEPDFSPVKTLEKITENPAESPIRQGDCYVNIGGELPYYLL